MWTNLRSACTNPKHHLIVVFLYFIRLHLLKKVILCYLHVFKPSHPLILTLFMAFVSLSMHKDHQFELILVLFPGNIFSCKYEKKYLQRINSQNYICRELASSFWSLLNSNMWQITKKHTRCTQPQLVYPYLRCGLFVVRAILLIVQFVSENHGQLCKASTIEKS